MNEEKNFISMDELIEEAKAYQKILEKQCYIENDHIVINVNYEYSVSLERCSTPEAILGWVVQLSHKEWINRHLIGRSLS